LRCGVKVNSDFVSNHKKLQFTLTQAFSLLPHHLKVAPVKVSWI